MISIILSERIYLCPILEWRQFSTELVPGSPRFGKTSLTQEDYTSSQEDYTSSQTRASLWAGEQALELLVLFLLTRPLTSGLLSIEAARPTPPL